MEIYDVLTRILENPEAPKFYRELQRIYENKGMENESQAFLKLLEIKFEENVINN